MLTAKTSFKEKILDYMELLEKEEFQCMNDAKRLNGRNKSYIEGKRNQIFLIRHDLFSLIKEEWQ